MFQAIYEAHHGAVVAYVRRRTVDPLDAQDAVAETFTIAWRRLGELEEADAALPWLYGVARRVLANQRRGNRRRADLSTRLGGQRVRTPDLEAEVLATEERRTVLAALARLRDADQEILGDVTKPDEVACYDRADPESPAGVAPLDARGPIAVCADLWRKGALGADPSARIVAFREAVALPFLDSPCVTPRDAAVIVRRELDRAGLTDWTIRGGDGLPGDGFSAQRPCATLAVRPELREVLLVATPQR